MARFCPSIRANRPYPANSPKKSNSIYKTMEDKRIYLVALLDEASNKKMATIYDELLQAGLVGEQTKNIPYHFTLGSFDLESEKEILENAQSICLKTKTFDISIHHIGLFGLKVLFLAPSINTELLTLYNDLVPNEFINGYHHISF